MKRFVCIVLSILLLLSAVVSCAEEGTASGDFIRSVREWAGALDLDREDYQASLSIDGNPAYGATLRKDGEVTEFAVRDLGRVQVSGSGLSLDVGGKQYSLEFAALAEMFKGFSSGGEGLAKDFELIRPWLQKALLQVLMPCVSVSWPHGGMVLHIEATDEEIRDRAYALIDEIMAERTTVETLLARYGTYLSLLVPGMPRTFDELKEAWEREKEEKTFYWRDFLVDADVTFSDNFGQTAVSVAGRLYIDQVCDYSLSFEMTSGREGFDLAATLQDGRRGGGYALEIRLHGNELRAKLFSDRFSYTLKGRWTAPDGGPVYVSASLEGDAYAGRTAAYELEADCDPAGGTLRATLDEIRTDRYAGTEKRQVAALDAAFRNGSLDGELTFGQQAVSFHLGLTDLYRHLKVGIRRAYGELLYYDLWIYRDEGNGRRIRLETNMPDGWDVSSYSVEISRDRFEFEQAKPAYGPVCHVLAEYRPTGGGFEVYAEYLNRIAPNPLFHTGKKPSVFRLAKDGTAWTAGLEWSMNGAAALTASAKLDLAEGNGWSFEAGAAHYDVEGLEDAAYALSAVPWTVRYTDRGGKYELKLAENTPGRLAITLTKDETTEMGSLALAPEDRRLAGILTVEGQEKAALVVEPIEKEPVETIEGIDLVDMLKTMMVILRR